MYEILVYGEGNDHMLKKPDLDMIKCDRNTNFLSVYILSEKQVQTFECDWIIINNNVIQLRTVAEPHSKSSGISYTPLFFIRFILLWIDIAY